MWNDRYLSKFGLKPPGTWLDLTRPEYFRHIGMSTPSRSGTTHMAVESILQSQGWEQGWATILKIGGNIATITARSYGVPDGVKDRRFGIGIVIDFFSLSLKYSGFPVSFIYPPQGSLLPANIALIKGSQNAEAAKQFIRFLISRKGQELLFEPAISRLPVMPSIYEKAPAGYPNPFKNGNSHAILFNTHLSRQRYHLINSMFDHLVTRRNKALNRTWNLIHEAEKRLKIESNPKAETLVTEAKKLATRVPVSSEDSQSPDFTSIFKRYRPGKPLPTEQVELEKSWETFSRLSLEKAMDLASRAIISIKSSNREND